MKKPSIPREELFFSSVEVCGWLVGEKQKLVDFLPYKPKKYSLREIPKFLYFLKFIDLIMG
jgi:hypothetical protein